MLIKSHNHSFFWVEDNQLFETYQTIRGRRWLNIQTPEGFQYPDTDICTEEDIEKINQILSNEN